MLPLHRLRTLWRNLRHRDRIERDLDDEVRTAFDLLVDEHVSAGASPADARRAATLQLGHPESIKTHLRTIRAGAWWDALVQDVRYGTRLLWRNPLFALTAALSLAICIGANTTVFSIANRLLFRGADGVRDPERLVDIAPTQGDGRFTEPVVPYRMYTSVRERATTLEDVYGYQLDVGAMSLRGPDGAERIFTTYVTSNYFSVLDIHPAIGRLFDRTDSDRPGTAPLAVLSYGFWKRRFNGDPAVLGQTLRVNDRPLTIVGVAPDGFHGLSVVVADVWLPLGAIPADQLESRLAIGGRLKPGVSIGQAAAEIDGIGRALQREMPSPPQAMGGLREQGGGGSLRVVRASAVPAVVRIALYAFLATLIVLASLVLVIACTNVSGVLLARATARRREIAVRLAMGAGRARLVRQLMTETLLLFVIGGAAGLALARIMTSLIVMALPAVPVPVDTALPLDGRVIAFTALASLFAAVVSGLVPALQASRADVVSALKDESQSTPDRLRLRSVFVVAQVAFSIVLVVTAGLLVRALNRSASVDLGFDASGIEVSTLDLSLAGYTPATAPQFVSDLLDRVRTTPGVTAATVAGSLPLGGQRRMCCGVEVPGVAPPGGERFFEPAWNVVAPGYFDTLRIRLLAGRDFDAKDRSGAENVAIVSEAAARRFWPGESAIGKHIVWQRMPNLFAPGTRPAMTPVRLSIVGVAANIKSGGTSPGPMVYVPLAQNYEPDVAVVARSTKGQRLTAEIREAVASANPNLPVIAASRLSDQGSPVITQLRVTASVSAAVGLVALMLAAIGIYGLTAYTVTRRTREIGIRLAMGAQRADVVRLVLRQGMSLVLIGSVIGLVLAAGASRLLVRLLFGIPPLDPVTFGAAALLFAAIGLVACYVPTRRAIRITANEALRYE
jgi:putative ABC transport system permease protein